jgi:hypothetical protein
MQIAARADMRLLVDTRAARVRQQYVLEFREPLGTPAREHVHARKRRCGEERRARDLGEAVRIVPRELFGRRIARGGYLWYGEEPVGPAWELVEAP